METPVDTKDEEPTDARRPWGLARLVADSRRFITEEVWERDITLLPRYEQLIYRLIRLASIIIRSFSLDRCRLRAAALTYVTVFSLIPLLALAFATAGFFKGDIKNKVQSLQERVIAKLAPGTERDFKPVIEKVQDFIENYHNLSMGAIGAVVLIISVFSLLANVEASLNDVWGVRRRRPFFMRMWTYWGVVTLGTIFLASSLSLTTLPSKIEVVRAILQNPFVAAGIHVIAPYITTTLFLFLVYRFMPNTAVEFKPALGGALVSGVLWEFLKNVYVYYVNVLLAGSNIYVTVYSGLAAVPLFLIWIYCSWMVFLLGAEIAYAIQNMESYRLDQTAKGVSEGYKDFLAMQVMLLVARNFMKGRLGLNVDDLAHEAHASVRLVNDVTYRLCRAGLLVETAQPRKCFSPAVPLEQITPYTVLKRIRSTGKFPGPLCATPDSEIIMKMVDRADAAGTESFKHLTYRELAEEANRRTEAAAAPAGQTPQASPTPGANPGT